jgi:outer membrane receptor protein involved in Fe transport
MPAIQFNLLLTTSGTPASVGQVARSWLAVLAACLLCTNTSVAADGLIDDMPRKLVVGESIAAVIDELRADGAPLAYSTALLPSTLRIIATPRQRSVHGVLQEILRPHGLTLQNLDGLYVVSHLREADANVARFAIQLNVRDAQTDAVVSGARVGGLPPSGSVKREGPTRRITIDLPPGRYPVTVSAPGYLELETILDAGSGPGQEITVRLTPRAVPLPEVIVAASRYEMLRDSMDTPTSIDRRSIMQIPDTGDDPIRAVQRLPGTAASGVSARAHLRGGTERETGIVLDGHRLLNPFHVRDYQSLFSAIDVRAIDGIEVYTGGFPVQYGDLTGGLVLVDSLTPEQAHRGEFGLSVFNTSLLSVGQVSGGDVEWVFSGRRGNLDLVLNKELGEPQYYDLYGKLAVNLNSDTRLSLNVLQVGDRVTLVPADEPDEREETINDTRNSQVWLSWEQQWTDALASQTIVSFSDFNSGRHALVNDPEKIIGRLSDERTFGFYRLNQDWTLSLSEQHHLGWGGEFQHLDAEYTYSSNVDYFGLYRNLPDRANSQSRDLARRVDGDAIAFYLADRWLVNKRLIADLGFRWDKQSYTDTDDNGQFSPRASLLYRLRPKTNLRLSWGRYYQSQGAHELQIEDGVMQFFPAQRFDQAILGIDYQLDAHYSLRAEVYHKKSTSLRPRFENLFDPLSVVPELEPDRVGIAAQRADLRGLEVSAAYEGDDGLDWWASYTLANAEDTVDGRTFARSWDQRHALQVGMTRSGERWGYSIAGKWHSGWPSTDVFLAPSPAAGEPDIVFGERNAGNFSDFFTLDMRLDYRRPIGIGYFNWFFEISNSTNRKNPCCVDFDLDQDVFGNRTLDKKDDYWFPLLPATGILIEF